MSLVYDNTQITSNIMFATAKTITTGCIYVQQFRDVITALREIIICVCTFEVVDTSCYVCGFRTQARTYARTLCRCVVGGEMYGGINLPTTC
jgi:hypothetical protein